MRKIFITLALLTVVSGAQAQKQKEIYSIGTTIFVTKC